MSKLWLLTKTLLKTGENAFSLGSNKKENIKKIGLLIFVLICLVPLMVGTTILVSDMYIGLKSLNMEGMLLGGVFSAASFIMLVFGIFSVISIYYFSNDIESLIILPIKPSKIVQAKFITVVLQQYLIEIIFTLPIIIAFGYNGGAGILFWIYYIIVFLTLPIVPIAISSIVCMIIMAFTKFVKNKDAFKTIASVFGIIFAIGINIVMQKIPNDNLGKMNELLKNNKDNFNMASNMFPTSKFAAKALMDNTSLNGFMNLVLFLIICLIAMIIFSYLGDMLYLKGAVGIKQSSSKRKKMNTKDVEKISVQSSSLKAYTLKEIKILFRTSAYFTQCVLSGILMPVILCVIYLAKQNNSVKIPEGYDIIVLIVGFAIVTLAMSNNYITATAISREGSNIFISKYLPVSYKTQINAKILSSFSVSIISLIIMAIMGIVILKLKPLLMVLIIISSIAGTVALANIGMLLDLVRPKLKWDAEIKAVKQNLNTFIMMIAIFAILGLVCFGAIQFNFTLIGTFIYIVGVSLIIAAITYALLITKGVKYFEKL